MPPKSATLKDQIKPKMTPLSCFHGRKLWSSQIRRAKNKNVLNDFAQHIGTAKKYRQFAYNWICIPCSLLPGTGDHHNFPPMRWQHYDVTEVTNHSAAAWGSVGDLSARCQRLHGRFIHPAPVTRSDHALMAPATLLTRTFLIRVTLTVRSLWGAGVMVVLFHLAVSILTGFLSLCQRHWCLKYKSCAVPLPPRCEN